jgi:hypothetical protein
VTLSCHLKIHSMARNIIIELAFSQLDVMKGFGMKFNEGRNKAFGIEMRT